MGKPITTLRERPCGLTRPTPSDTVDRFSGTGFIYIPDLTLNDVCDAFCTCPSRRNSGFPACSISTVTVIGLTISLQDRPQTLNSVDDESTMDQDLFLLANEQG